jgi:serine/threonine-protein kinase RsbW
VTVSVSVTLANDQSEVEKLSRLVEAFGEVHGLTPQSTFSVNLALDEVVTNIIRYAYNDNGPAHPILVRLTFEDGVLAAQVEDNGRAFNPLEAPAPDIDASIEERPVGGLGIHLVRSMMDSVEYRRDDGRNVFIMKKRL